MNQFDKRYRRKSASGEAFRADPVRDREELKLDYNELPYAPSVAGNNSLGLNRYPETENIDLVDKVARYYGVDPSAAAITHGVDEAVDRVIQLYPGHSFVVFKPTFCGFIERFKANEVSVRSFDLNSDFRIADADLAGIGSNDIVFIASPGNPTGHLFRDEEIEALARSARAVFLDETYIDFSSSKGWLTRHSENMFLFRSFSKSFGLAGARAGFLAGPVKEMEKIRKKQWFCNMSTQVIAAINESLASNWYLPIVQGVIAERVRVVNELRRMRFDVVLTETNFILLKDKFGVLITEFEKNNIRVKSLAGLDMPGYLRLSIDTPENNDRMLKALLPLSLADREPEFYSEKYISAA